MKQVQEKYDEINANNEMHKEQLMTQIEEQNKEIEVLKDRVSQAGSLKEDREKIAHLEKIVQDRNQLLSKLFNELKHYQQEFANREMSYNKIFTTKPQVGVLNVLERRMKKDVFDKSLPPLADQIDKVEKTEKRASTSLSARRKPPTRSSKH